jgi:hypothetical protein
MRGVKALIAGISTIIILGLFGQLTVLLAEVAYNSLAENFTFLYPYRKPFSYVMMATGFALVMLCGGYVTAAIAHQKIYLYSSIAAIVSCSISLWSSLITEIFTPLAIVFLSYGLVFSLLGSWFWKKKHNIAYTATDIV